MQQKTYMQTHYADPRYLTVRVLFGTPLLTANRLERALQQQQLYQAELNAMYVDTPNLHPTEHLEKLSANYPYHITRKIGLHGSYRIKFSSIADAVDAPVNHRITENCRTDPWLHLVQYLQDHPDHPFHHYVDRLRDSQKHLERWIGLEAARRSWPYAKCNQCCGRGHG